MAADQCSVGWWECVTAACTRHESWTQRVSERGERQRRGSLAADGVVKERRKSKTEKKNEQVQILGLMDGERRWTEERMVFCLELIL